eukprot:1164946-Amphidinium_carterae.2
MLLFFLAELSVNGGVLAGGAATVTSGTLNVTSVYSTAPALRDIPLSLLAVQETKLCVGDTSVLNMLRKRWDIYLPELPLGDGDRRTRSGGVMLLYICERQWKVDVISMDGLRAAKHNFLLFGLHHKPTGFRCHGAVYYGRPSCHADTVQDLHAIASFLLQQGSGNLVILTDHNLDATERTPEVLGDCALDLPRWVSAQKGRQAEHTCFTVHGSSRPDSIFCNAGLVTIAQSCVVYPWADVPTHRVVEARFTLVSLQEWWQRTDKAILATTDRKAEQIKQALAAVNAGALPPCGSFRQWTTVWKQCLVAAAGLEQSDWQRKYHVHAPEERSFTMGQKGSSRWTRALANLVGRLHRLTRMADKRGSEAAVLWRKILRGVPPFEKRFGAPTLLAGDWSGTASDAGGDHLECAPVHL